MHRHALVLAVVSLIVARSATTETALVIRNVVTFQRYRAERRRRALEKQARERETPLNTPALEKKMVDLFIPDVTGSRTLLVPHRGRVSRVQLVPIGRETYDQHRHLFPVRAETLGVNKRFWQMLFAVLKVAFPTKTGKEAFLLTLHTMFLIIRTILSVMVARLDGRIVRDLVSANGKGFLRGLGWWFALALPSTYTNAMIRFLERKLALAFRTNLTRYIHDLYLNDNLNYYKFGLGGEGADQLITTDLAKFCDSLAALYGNMGKPFLDMVIFTSQLAAGLGPLGTIGLFANYGLTAWILKLATPAFGRMAATEAKLEGEYRAGLGRIGRDGEEVAFYNGGARERVILGDMYRRLVDHIHSVFKIRIPYGMTEDFVIKYAWSAAGYGLMSIPILTGAKTDVAHRTESYVSNRRLLLSLADAGGRLMYSGKDLAELSGYTGRVYSLLASLHALDHGDYPPSEGVYDMGNIRGRVILGRNHLVLKGVPVVAPSGGDRGGEELIQSLDLVVEKGDHTLITGPNGVGKTSIARIVAELWPTWSGLLERPLFGEGGVFFLPQRPYLSIGSLRDQVIYPHTYAEMKASGRTETELMNILSHVHLGYLTAREGGWDTRKEWKDVLSGGEKQRMGMARLFYHRPRFAILDECTSAVSSDVEGLMYEHAKQLGITLVTIS